MGTHTIVDAPSVWRAGDGARSEGWTVRLGDGQRREIIDAARQAAADGHTVSTLQSEGLALPSFSLDVTSWSHALNDGRGFLLLRGFPIEDLTAAEIELAYVGLGMRLGTPVGQDRQASVLTHIRDERTPRTDPSVRLYRTHARQDFHTDGSDIVALLCLHKARQGGESRIASSMAIYNEILSTRPDLLDVLYEPMYWDRNGEESPGEDPYFALPPVNDVGGLPRFFYIGWYVTDAQRHPDVPRLTDSQLEAMALIERLANDPLFHVEMDFEPGDIQLLSNAKILHAREAYEDAEDLNERRYLLRLWLTAHDFASVEDFLRAGIPKQSNAVVD
ncbi:MAG: TauD/TfdA family dioxygenase [Acidimicrobiales bacterium]